MKKKQIEHTLGIKLTDVEYRSSANALKGGNSTKIRKNARFTGGGNFHDPYLLLANSFNDALKNAMSFRPVVELDPKLYKAEKQELTYVEHRRFLAAKLARKYYSFGRMKIYANWLRSTTPLSMYRCAVIIGYARTIREWIKTEEGKNDKP